MVNKFSTTKQNKILYCIVDNTNRTESSWAREININLSDFLLHRIINYKFDVFISDDENLLLKQAVSENFYTHAVIISSGMSLGLSDRFFYEISKKCQEDFFIAGHVLDRNENSFWKNGYYELHHQLYIVNLSEYKEIGLPFVGNQEQVSHKQIEPNRSQECLNNDHEVAAWLGKGNNEKVYDMKCHGWNIIAEGLNHNKKFIDLGTGIRENKKYLYYEYDHVFLKEIKSLYHDQFFMNNFVCAWNSDSFNEYLIVDGPIEQYITVATGLFWVVYLNRFGISNNTKVIFTDINQHTLNFMKLMILEWDGKNYPDFYKKNIQKLPSGFNKDINLYFDYTDQQWKEFLIKNSNWGVMWSNIKNCRFEFILIDYMNHYDLSWIEKGKQTFLNLSDVFTHSPYIFGQGLKYRISCENKLLKDLKDIDPEIFLNLTARSTDSFYPSDKLIKKGKVKDFDFTDINELNRPAWHEEDWKSSRILGI